MTCPVCDCEYFYIKDPDNSAKYYKFKSAAGDIVFEEEDAAAHLNAAESEIMAHCIQCVWQGKLEELKPAK